MRRADWSTPSAKHGGRISANHALALVPAAAHPAPSLAAALEGKAQAYEEATALLLDGELSRAEYRNRIERAGPDVEIDGISFAHLRLHSRAKDAIAGEFHNIFFYYNSDLGFPIDGESESGFAGSVTKYDTTPLDLIFPGEDGFEVNSAVVGCEVESGALIPEYEVSPA